MILAWYDCNHCTVSEENICYTNCLWKKKTHQGAISFTVEALFKEACHPTTVSIRI